MKECDRQCGRSSFPALVNRNKVPASRLGPHRAAESWSEPEADGSSRGPLRSCPFLARELPKQETHFILLPITSIPVQPMTRPGGVMRAARALHQSPRARLRAGLPWAHECFVRTLRRSTPAYGKCGWHGSRRSHFPQGPSSTFKWRSTPRDNQRLSIYVRTWPRRSVGG